MSLVYAKKDVVYAAKPGVHHTMGPVYHKLLFVHAAMAFCTTQSQLLKKILRRGYKKRKVYCRNSRPLTIACHMKKNVKSVLCAGYLFLFLSLLFTSLPVNPLLMM